MENELYELTTEQTNFLLLSQKINEPALCKYILFLKDKSERNETLNYHIDRWFKIPCIHFEIQKNNKVGKHSYIIDGQNYVICKDYNSDFYNETGISYQVVELLHEIINEPNKEDDIMYAELAKRIMIRMRG